ncbi:unnamed protein product [Parajaminaea phylloscopi]
MANLQVKVRVDSGHKAIETERAAFPDAFTAEGKLKTVNLGYATPAQLTALKETKLKAGHRGGKYVYFDPETGADLMTSAYEKHLKRKTLTNNYARRKLHEKLVCRTREYYGLPDGTEATRAHSKENWAKLTPEGKAAAYDRSNAYQKTDKSKAARKRRWASDQLKRRLGLKEPRKVKTKASYRVMAAGRAAHESKLARAFVKKALEENPSPSDTEDTPGTIPPLLRPFGLSSAIAGLASNPRCHGRQAT